MTSAAARSGTVVSSSAPGRRPPVSDRFLDTVLARYAGHARTVIVTVPAPPVPLTEVFRLADDPTVVLWEPPEGPGFVGIGEAHSMAPEGELRCEGARLRAESVGARLEAVYHPQVPPARPRWFGGLAFAPGSADEGPWAAFGDGRFVLPRFAYGRLGSRAWLSFAADGETLDPHEAADRVRSLLAQIEARRQHEAERGEGGRSRVGPVEVRHLSREVWDGQVYGIREQIEQGRFDKVVAARRTEVRAGSPFDVTSVLEHLGSHYPDCTRFAHRAGDAVFVGASPERLVSRQGRRVRSEAMAGSVPHGAGQTLLASDKDRREHDLVVDAVLDRLAPYCVSLERSPEPRVRELPNVVHLHTPVSGELLARIHVLDLVERLHPTPAVGGVPLGAAVEWISRFEATPRGWYSGPMGWFDVEGDGEFVVALRSGLVRGSEAWAYAGAGIVRGSAPDAEYAETALKLRPVLGALGALSSDGG